MSDLLSEKAGIHTPQPSPHADGTSATPPPAPITGALVVSLDLELHWGVRETCRPGGSYERNILGAWQAVPRLLDLFEEFDVAATWAAVGFLFARSREELHHFRPKRRPRYRDQCHDPYLEPVGENEVDDPVHYAPSLITAIHARARQEIGTHTFSHYCCTAPGQDVEDFRADMESAIAIAATHGVRPVSIVFPHNLYPPEYLDILPQLGIRNYRGNTSGWMFRCSLSSSYPVRRAARLLDQYARLNGHNGTPWQDLAQPNGMINVPASRFLRPVSDRRGFLRDLRFRRIALSMRDAARRGRIYHLWWHPCNFGVETDKNLRFLRRILTEFSTLRARYGMRSLSMGEVGEIANCREHERGALLPR